MKAKDVVVVGVSGDEPKGLALFDRVNSLGFPLLSDAKGEAAKKFGVPTRGGGQVKKVIDGENFTLNRNVTTGRYTIVINKEGKIAAAYKVGNAAEDSNKILKLLKE